MAIVILLHYRKSKFCRGHKFSNIVKIVLFISDVQHYIPIKLCKTSGSLHLFKITGTLTSEDIKLNRNYLWDTLEINWDKIKLAFNNIEIKLPKLVTIKIQDKIRVRRMMSRETQNFHIMVKQRNDMVQSRNSINSRTFLYFRWHVYSSQSTISCTGYFRCKLPVEVVDMEVKVMSMQGKHIFRRDQMTQLVRCILWTPNLCLHPNMIKKMKTFLEVENKMGPIIPAPASQYRLPLPEMNGNVRKGNATKKRKTVTPKRRFRPVTPKATAMHLTLITSPTKTHQQCSCSISTCNGKTRYPMAQYRQDVRQFVPGQELVSSKRLFGHRGRKGGNGKALPKRRETKWENKIPRKRSVVGGTTALYARHKRKKPILPINRNQ